MRLTSAALLANLQSLTINMATASRQQSTPPPARPRTATTTEGGNM
jgi:hypothetical protein